MEYGDGEGGVIKARLLLIGRARFRHGLTATV